MRPTARPTARPTREPLDRSKVFKYMWHVIRTTRVSKSVALQLAWAKTREKQEGLLDEWQGKKLKTNGLTGQKYHFRKNGDLYTCYRENGTIKITTTQAYYTRINNRLDARGRDRGASRYRWA
jgi:hypothetical protein